MKITVTITAWHVPFDQMVIDQATFDGVDAEQCALVFINDASKAWWDATDGDRCVLEMANEPVYNRPEPYQPISEVGYDPARYVLWGGESGFHAMIDKASYAALHEAHYKREYDDKGHQRPGYLLNAYAGDNPVGQTLTSEQADYCNDQLSKIALMGSEPKGNS
jgi:hypothetical protein